LPVDETSPWSKLGHPTADLIDQLRNSDPLPVTFLLSEQWNELTQNNGLVAADREMDVKSSSEVEERDDHSGADEIVVHDPVVVVIDRVDSLRELIPILEYITNMPSERESASRDICHPLVVIATQWSDSVLVDIAINLQQKALLCLPFFLVESDLNEVATRLSVTRLERIDLQAGDLSTAGVRVLKAWLSDRQQSFFLTIGD
jgi:hypothetical protein